MKKTLILIIATFSILSCKQPEPDLTSNFIGVWTAPISNKTTETQGQNTNTYQSVGYISWKIEKGFGNKVKISSNQVSTNTSITKNQAGTTLRSSADSYTAKFFIADITVSSSNQFSINEAVISNYAFNNLTNIQYVTIVGTGTLTGTNLSVLMKVTDNKTSQMQTVSLDFIK